MRGPRRKKNKEEKKRYFPAWHPTGEMQLATSKARGAHQTRIERRSLSQARNAGKSGLASPAIANRNKLKCGSCR